MELNDSPPHTLVSLKGILISLPSPPLDAFSVLTLCTSVVPIYSLLQHCHIFFYRLSIGYALRHMQPLVFAVDSGTVTECFMLCLCLSYRDVRL